MKSKIVLAVSITMSLLLQSCLMTVLLPVRRINSSTFIDESKFEIAAAGELTQAYEITSNGDYKTSSDMLGDFELGIKLRKDFKLLGNFSITSNNVRSTQGSLFMTGIEKDFRLKESLYYAATLQGQYSFISDEGGDEAYDGTILMSSKMFALGVTNELVYQPTRNFVLRTGIYYDHVRNSTSISGGYNTDVKFYDNVFGVPMKISFRFGSFEVFGGTMFLFNIGSSRFHNEPTVLYLGSKISFGE